MSPASYRAAPPRVGRCNVTRIPRQDQIEVTNTLTCVRNDLRQHAIRVLPLVVAELLLRQGFAVGVDCGDASTALLSASLSFACAWPYAAKSPRLSAASPSAYAASASLSARARAPELGGPVCGG